jgi:hypothetical protein
MFEILTITLPTLGLGYVTATSPARRQRHREFITRDIWILCRHHGQWVLWQVTAYLPKRRAR